MVNLQAVAGEVAQVDEVIIRALPFVGGIIGFVPGGAVAAPFIPLVGEILQAVDNAAKHIQNNDPQAAVEDILTEIRNHLTPGRPNSAVLSSPLMAPASPPGQITAE